MRFKIMLDWQSLSVTKETMLHLLLAMEARGSIT